MADAPRQDVTELAAAGMPRGIVPRVLQSWWAPRRVVRGLAGMPDRVMLAVLMAALLIFLVAQLPTHARAAHLDPSVPLAARMGGAAMAVIFIMPLVAYALATLVSALSHLTPWKVTGAQSRLALFWALLAVAPAMLLTGLVAGMIGPGPGLVLVQAITGIGFMMIWVAGLAAQVGR